MDSVDHRGRRFGARVRHDRSSMHSPPRQRSSSSNTSYYPSNTLEFSDVASRRPTNYRRNGNWAEEGHDQFNFSEEGHYEANSQANRPQKYASTRPKASGQSIGVPGSSILQPSAVSKDLVLNNVFNPPSKQNDFLANITKSNTNQNRGSGVTLKAMAYDTLSLEAASAPLPRQNFSQSSRLSGGWVNTRPVRTPSKPRTQLESTEKRMKLNDERKTSSLGTNHYTLRDRTKPRLFEINSDLTPSFSIRNKQPTRLGKRKNSEGSAQKPIALDSDSDSDSELEVQSNNESRVKSGDEDLTDSPVNEEKEEKRPAVDLQEIEQSAVERIHNCDVMIGLFQCVVDLFFQCDRLCMRNIRAKYDKWPFESFYLFEYKDLQDVRFYPVSKEADTIEIDAEETDRMQQLLDEASFVALQCPLPVETDQTAMKSFYDPSGSDASREYLVLRPLEDATGSSLEAVIDLLLTQTDIKTLNEKQAEEHLQSLVKDPFTYCADWRSQRRKSSGDNHSDASSSSESDEDDIAGNATVLTYPLPPCTSDIVTIIGHDVSRLKPKRYLNDNIIDYYFKRLMLETFRDNKIVQEKVLFLSSHFYSRLRAGKGSSSRARMEAGYKNVSTWLTRSNFFQRSIIFIPINKDVHWSLAVILNPGLAGSDLLDEDDAFSCIAVLDPLGSYHRKTAIIRNLRAFLRMEWENSGGRTQDEAVVEYGIDRVLTMNVKAPLQDNSYDCGVYVLKFAEVILKNCLELGLLTANKGIIGKDVTDDDLDALITSNAFSAKDIQVTRKQIRQYIEVDSSDYQVRKQRPKAAKM